MLTLCPDLMALLTGCSSSPEELLRLPTISSRLEIQFKHFSLDQLDQKVDVNDKYSFVIFLAFSVITGSSTLSITISPNYVMVLDKLSSRGRVVKATD